jgi:LAS superfamily LD-carboxypeptidase LdcB
VAVMMMFAWGQSLVTVLQTNCWPYWFKLQYAISIIQEPPTAISVLLTFALGKSLVTVLQTNCWPYWFKLQYAISNIQEPLTGFILSRWCICFYFVENFHLHS